MEGGSRSHAHPGEWPGFNGCSPTLICSAREAQGQLLWEASSGLCLAGKAGRAAGRAGDRWSCGTVSSVQNELVRLWWGTRHSATAQWKIRLLSSARKADDTAPPPEGTRHHCRDHWEVVSFLAPTLGWWLCEHRQVTPLSWASAASLERQPQHVSRGLLEGFCVIPMR